MDFESVINGVGSFIKSQGEQYERNFRSFLRKKSDQELLYAYRKMDKSKIEFRWLVDEIKRRKLI